MNTAQASRRTVLFFAFVVAIFLLRSLVTFPVEHHDATVKYFAASKIVRTGDWSILLWDHHTMRWAEMVPQTAISWLLGLRYEALYVLPLLMFSLYVALIARGMRGGFEWRHQAVLLALLFTEPLALMHTGQLMNPPFGVLFSIAGILLLLNRSHQGMVGTMLAAALFFLAYGAHVTYLSFAGGAFLWLLVRDRQVARAAWFTGTLIALIALETVAFNLLSGGELTLGRFEALAGGRHVMKVQGVFQPATVSMLFTRWLRMPDFDLVMAAGFVLCTLWLWRDRAARAAAPDFVKLCLLTGWVYSLSITFAVLDLDPLRPMMPLIPMYLEPAFPYFIIGFAYLFCRWEARLPPRWRWSLMAAAGVVAVTTVTLFVLAKGPLRETFNNRMNAFMWRSEAELSDYARRFSTGELILRGHNRRALAFVARYRFPVKVIQDHRSKRTSVPDPQPDALCLTHIRKIPLKRNYQDCATIKWRSPYRWKTL